MIFSLLKNLKVKVQEAVTFPDVMKNGGIYCMEEKCHFSLEDG